jgi:hypothetical protein
LTSSSSIVSFPATAARRPPLRCCYGKSTSRYGNCEVYGFERAARAYRASFDAVAGLKSLVSQLGIACDMRAKSSLYLAAGDSSGELLEEHRLRERATLPGDFLDHGMLFDRFGFARKGSRRFGRPQGPTSGFAGPAHSIPRATACP